MMFAGQVVCSHRNPEGHDASSEVLRFRLSKEAFEDKKGSLN